MDESVEMSFDNAVQHVLKDKSAIFYAFTPTFGVAKEVVGGILYIIQYDIDDEKDDLYNMSIIYLGGRFNDDFIEEDYFSLKDIPKHGKNLNYRLSNIEHPHNFFTQSLNVTLKRLIGLSRDEALKKNSCPECDQIIFLTGQNTKCEQCKNS